MALLSVGFKDQLSAAYLYDSLKLLLKQFQLVICICNRPAFASEFLSPQVSVTLYACAVKNFYLYRAYTKGKTRKTCH